MFFADGFEEVEAIAALDVIRRADIEIKSVGVGEKTITGSHSIPVVCDLTTDDISFDGLDGVILPGGMPGTLNLENSSVGAKIYTEFKRRRPLTSVAHSGDKLRVRACINVVRSAVKDADRPKIARKGIALEGSARIDTLRRFDKSRIEDVGRA